MINLVYRDFKTPGTYNTGHLDMCLTFSHVKSGQCYYLFFTSIVPRYIIFSCIYFSIIWILMVFGSLVLFTLHMTSRVQAYLTYDTTITEEKIYVENIDMPVVTICNQNRYRYVYSITL